MAQKITDRELRTLLMYSHGYLQFHAPINGKTTALMAKLQKAWESLEIQP